MSRSFNHRNKDNSINVFLKHIVGASSFRARHMNEEEKKERENNILSYRIGRYEQNVPKYFRKNLNKTKKNKDKKQLIYAINNDSFDDLAHPYWPKDAGYIYW